MASFSTFGASFASGSRTQHSPQSQQPTSRPPPVDLVALENASRVLLDQLAKDAQAIPDLGDALLGTAAGSVSANYSVFPDDTRVPFQKRRFVGIPDGLFQFYDTASVATHMGIMPEIERVWISIDHKLFLWDYNDGQELASFVGQPDVITHVAIVNPKPGLFVDDITHLLVICTPISVLLLGVSVTINSLDSRAPKALALYATDFTISTDVEMTSVVGTPDGRIFMCGVQDGALYEFHYQATESWFAKRVQLVNHSASGVSSLLPRFASTTVEDRITLLVTDNDRDQFFALTEHGSICVYKPNGEKTVAHLQSLHNLPKLAQEKAPGSPALSGSMGVISLHVVSPSESRAGIQLIAVTENGVRLFFGPSATYYGYSGSRRPLSLIHVRLPPINLIHPDDQYRPSTSPAQPSSRSYALKALDCASYHNGLFIAAQPGDSDGNDFIACLAPDLTQIGNIGPPKPQTVQTWSANAVPTPTRQPMAEYASLLSIPGRTWAVANVVNSTPPPVPEGTPSPSSINELATQFNRTATQFMLLTNVGLTFLMRRRAVDHLIAVLEDLHSAQNVQALVEFRDSFGREQTCAMLIALASGNAFLDGTESSLATVSHVNPEIAAVAKQAFYDFGERPIWQERAMYGTAENAGTAIYSGRRDGLALYFARLVRPFWKSKLVKMGPSKLLELSVSDHDLMQMQQNLFALKDFLDKNPHLFFSAPAEREAGGGSIADQEAWKAENTSVSDLRALLGRTIEALSFVMLLSDYSLGDLIKHCDPETKKLVEATTFESLVTTSKGMTISRALVNVLIDQQIGQQISVDTISEVLQSRCGSFCSTDDVMLYKAKENIRMAAETRNVNEQQNCLAEALRLFTKGARTLDFEKLREIVGDFQQLHYAKGAVQLPLACASAQDPDNIGLAYWQNSVSHDPKDPRSDIIKVRLQNYDLILDSLSVFEANAEKSASGSQEALTAIRVHAYDLAFASDDEMFHSTLYDWLIFRRMSDQLLEMRPKYLEAHLCREPGTVAKFGLLWQFYVKNGDPLRAAEVLKMMALNEEFALNLDDRVECLTLAVTNVKSEMSSAPNHYEHIATFGTDLEERLEVAQVQLEFYQTLAPNIDDDPAVGAVIRPLGMKLYGMTDLWSCALSFDMPFLKLLVLHVSEQRDETIVRPIWQQIFTEIVDSTPDVAMQKDYIFKQVAQLGIRFYPSESSFPLRFVASHIVKFRLVNKEEVPPGWASRLLDQCGVPYVDIWEILHSMYESQVPPFNEQTNVQALSDEIAVLLNDWMTEVDRPQSRASRAEIPVARIDNAIDQYVKELKGNRQETRVLYEDVKRALRRHL